MRTVKYTSTLWCTLIVGLFALLLPSTLWASEQVQGHAHQEATKEAAEFDLESLDEPEHEMAMGHHAFAHPFLTHMGIPDGPGEISIRVGATQEAYNDEVSRDLALHIETGIWNRVGLHFRNDAIKANTHAEMMIQYAVLQNKHGDSGISAFVELEFPTNYVPEDKDKVEAEVGLSARNTFSKYGIIDAGIHYSPEESMVTIEASGILRLTPTIFPIIEGNMEIGGDETIANLLAGLKMRLRPGTNLGVGGQFGLTEHRHFDNQAIVQLDIAY
jgi:hypothetical protein